MDLSSDLYVLLINCLDGVMLDPYLQGGPCSFSHQGISMLQDLVNTYQSSSSAGLVSVFTRFLQAGMLQLNPLCSTALVSVALSHNLAALVSPLQSLSFACW
jgi:hypothetical protein